MSKGGGGGGTTSTNTSNLPEYAEPYYKDLLARTGYETAQGYTPYGGSRLEYFNAPEQESMRRMSELGMSGNPAELDMAGQVSGLVGQGNPYATSMMQATQGAQAYLGANAGKLDTQNWIDPGVTPAYMSPYMQNVVDVQKREALRDSDVQQSQIGLDAAGHGSLGGYREAIMRSENQRNTGQRLDDIQAKGLQSAYDTGLGAFDADRAARLQGAGMGREYAATSAGLGNSAYNSLLSGDAMRLQGAGQLAEYAGQRQGMEYERLMNMQAAGQNERDLRQRGLDMGYSDFLRQQAYPKEQLAFYQAMIGNLPIQPGSVQQSYGLGPSESQQLLGSGIAGVGLYNAYR